MLRRLGALLPRCAAAAHSCAAETATCSSSAAASQSGLRNAWQGPASYHSSSSTWHGGHSSDEDENVQKVTVTFVDKDGTEHKVLAPVGKHLLEVAHDNDIELEGACEASLACSTCHVIVEDEAFFNQLPEPTEDELDMLDLAFGLTDTSRLGCQVVVTPELDGLRVRIPSATRNFYVDGHVPKPH